MPCAGHHRHHAPTLAVRTPPYRFLPWFPQVPEEASAVYNVLAIIENMIEVKPAIAEQVVEKTKVRPASPFLCVLLCKDVL